MSAVLKLTANGCINNICLIYDFKQVSDAILVIMYVDKLHTWEKIFISYEEGAWDTSVLAYYTDANAYRQICNKLKLVFMKHAHAGEEKALYLENTMREDALFMLEIYS